MAKRIDKTSDSELIARWRRDADPDAFAQLIGHHERWVRRFAESLVGRREDAEDVAQETFVRAYMGLAKLRHPESFRGWLRQIVLGICKDCLRARYACRRRARRQARLRGPGASCGNLLDALERLELSQVVTACLRSMPAQHHLPLMLYFLDELSERETAVLLGVREATLRSKVHRAKIKLKPALTAYIEQGELMFGRSNPSEFAQAVMSGRALGAMQRAWREALSRDHAYLGTEHVLVGIAEEEDGLAAQVLRSHGITPELIRRRMSELLLDGPSAGKRSPTPTPPMPDPQRLGRLLPPKAIRACRAAVAEALAQGEIRLTPEYLLLGVLAVSDSVGARIVRQLGGDVQSLQRELCGAGERG